MKRDHISLRLKKHYRLLQTLVILVAALPALKLIFDFATDSLGVNPLQYLQQTTGLVAALFLAITLAVTPLRRQLAYGSRLAQLKYGKRLSDWNWIIKTRKVFGLASFYYALMHLMIYLHWDLGYDWGWLKEDVEQKPYLVIGFISFILIGVLAATSPNRMMRKLGKRWRQIHRLVYPLAILVLVHQWMGTKTGDIWPYITTLIILGLLAYRVLAAWGFIFNKPQDDGMEVAPRPSRAN